MAKKQVRVVYEIVVEVEASSTIETVLDEADYVLGSSSIKPYILSPEDNQLLSDDDLSRYVEA